MRISLQRRVEAFTLVEMLVVVVVLAMIAGLTYPIVTVYQRKAQRTSTKTLVDAVASAIQLYRQKDAEVTVDGKTIIRRMWDLDRDPNALMDGDPQSGWLPDPTNGVLTSPPWYRGFARQATIPLPAWAVDDYGQIVDRWRRPLRIAWSAQVYGASGFGVWSIGRDGLDQGGEATSDDITSWSNRDGR